jgi:hypothetical protein
MLCGDNNVIREHFVHVNNCNKPMENPLWSVYLEYIRSSGPEGFVSSFKYGFKFDIWVKISKNKIYKEKLAADQSTYIPQIYCDGHTFKVR